MKMKQKFHFIVFTATAVSNLEMFTKNVFFVVKAKGRVRATHSHAFMHLGAVQFQQCHRVLLTDHLHQLLRSACLREYRLSEMREGKDRAGAGRDKIQQQLCVSPHRHTHTHSLFSLTPPCHPTLSTPVLPPPLSLFSSRYMCSERQLGEQFRARAKDTHTH